MRRLIYIAGVVMLAVTVRLLLRSGFTNNLYFAAGITAVLWGYGLGYRTLIKKRWLTVAIASLALFFMGLAIFIHAYGQHDTVTYQEEVAIILGAGLRGEQVSLMLQMRLDKAVEYYHKNPSAVLLVTGGQGSDEILSEASAMERYLLDANIPAGNIIKEEAALSTYENIAFSKKILDDYFNGTYTAAIITSDFHIYRASRFAAAAGITATHFHANTPWYGQPVNYARECAAIIKLWLLKR